VSLELQIRRSRARFPGTTRKKKLVSLERGPLSLVSITEELLGRNTVRTIISAPPLQNAVSHTSAERMQLLLCRSPIAVVWLTTFCSGGALMIVPTVVAAPVSKTGNTAVGIRHADHVAPSIRKKLILSLLTSGGRSVGWYSSLADWGHGVHPSRLCYQSINKEINININAVGNEKRENDCGLQRFIKSTWLFETYLPVPAVYVCQTLPSLQSLFICLRQHLYWRQGL
jgi:hypothetical protein